MNVKRIVTIDLPDVVYRRLLRLAARLGWTSAREIEHLTLKQFDRDHTQAEFDKLVREIGRGSGKD